MTNASASGGHTDGDNSDDGVAIIAETREKKNFFLNWKAKRSEK